MTDINLDGLNSAGPAVDPQAPTLQHNPPPAAPEIAAPAAPLVTPDIAGPVSQPDAVTAGAGDVAANTQKIQKIAAESTAPPPPGPHARLAAMVSGLMTGLDAFGKSIATGGREGGVQEVVQVQAEEQRQKQAAQEARDASKNQRLQQQIAVGQTLQSQFQNIQLMQTLPDEIALHHLQVAEAQTNLAGAQQQIDIAGADFAKQNWGLSPAQLNGKDPLTPQSVTNGQSMLTRAIGDENRGALAVLGAKDPAVVEAQRIASLPNPAPKDIVAAGQGLIVAQQQSAATTEAKTKQAADLTAQLKLQQDQGAQALYTRTVSKNAAGQPVEDFPTWQARTTKEAEVTAQQGDPSQLGAMAADGLITIPQIALARQLDKKGFQQLLAGADAEAKKNGAPEIVVNGRGTGHYFNANAATQQYDYIKEFNNPNNKSQQSITAGSTFLEHSADLLDVNAKYRRTNNALVNTPLNKIAKNFGNEVYSEYIAALAPVKTEYDNALKAGFAPSAEDQKSVDALLNPASSPAQIEGAVKTMAHTILRRLDNTNQGYKTHTGVDYPNMITPDAADAARKMGVPTGTLQSGGGFGGTPQAVNAGTTSGTQPSGKAVSLRAAMALPAYRGKSEAEVRAAIIAQGHQVNP